MSGIGFLHRAVLAGSLTLSLAGVAGSLDAAQAMPAAPPATSAAAGGLVTVQYYGGYGYRGYRRPYYGYRYRGRAGLYRCGPYAQHTHLQRQACR